MFVYPIRFYHQEGVHYQLTETRITQVFKSLFAKWGRQVIFGIMLEYTWQM